jgi:murein DD-endopeptidase MepM/ murein hydrolase activator NlpD
VKLRLKHGLYIAGAAAAATLAILYFSRWRKVQPIKGKITSKFGNRQSPTSGASTFHNGVDISVPEGTKVKSPWAGKVTSVMTNNAGGLQMVVTHYNGHKTGYAHLSEVKKEKGDVVLAGQVIALSGNTGNSTGPHLHFTLTDRNGDKIDPETKFTFK